MHTYLWFDAFSIVIFRTHRDGAVCGKLIEDPLEVDHGYDGCHRHCVISNGWLAFCNHTRNNDDVLSEAINIGFLFLSAPIMNASTIRVGEFGESWRRKGKLECEQIFLQKPVFMHQRCDLVLLFHHVRRGTRICALGWNQVNCYTLTI